MRRRRGFGALVCLVVVLFFTTACDWFESGVGSNPPVPDGGTQVITYQGRDLPCAVYNLPRSEHGYDCNFRGFYEWPDRRYPELKRVDPKAARERVVQYHGVNLHCFVYFAGVNEGTNGKTCDYERWIKEGALLADGRRRCHWGLRVSVASFVMRRLRETGGAGCIWLTG